MNHRCSILFSVMVLLPLLAFSQDNDDSRTNVSLLELLEFLGEFETEDGEWIDPEVLLEAVFPEPDDSEDSDEDEN